MKREIRKGAKVFAIIIDATKFPEGAHPATDASWPLQMLVMKRPKGYVVRKHMHKKITRTISQSQEALIVIRGSARATIYDRQKKRLGACKVGAGECLIIADGMHEVAFTKDTIAYECKTGPYIEDKIFT